MTPPTRIDVHLAPDSYLSALRADVSAGLARSPKELPPKWFYDDRGSDLFDQITRLPEYYPTRREKEILEARAAEIVDRSGADTLVELGSGTSEKTRVLLDAFSAAGRLDRFMPFDVSEQTLRDAAVAINAEYPEVEVHGVVGDFDHHLGLLPREGRRMVAFLGGTIGNFSPEARQRFLADLRSGLEPGDSLLLGTDLVKDPTRLVAAYDDAAGVTAEFNRNVLVVINRELGADFDVDGFEHVARWNDAEHRIEMWLRTDAAQKVRIADLDLDVAFEAGEEMRTELSTKFTRDLIAPDLAAAGFEIGDWWTDEADDYALSLSTVV